MTGNYRATHVGIRGTGRSARVWQDPCAKLGPSWPFTSAVLPEHQLQGRSSQATGVLSQADPGLRGPEHQRVGQEDEKAVRQGSVAEQVPRRCPHPGPMDLGTWSLTRQKELQMGLRLRAS